MLLAAWISVSTLNASAVEQGSAADVNELFAFSHISEKPTIRPLKCETLESRRAPSNSHKPVYGQSRMANYSEVDAIFVNISALVG